MRIPACLAVVVAFAAAAPARAADRAVAKARVSACATASDAAQRSVTFEADMHSVPGAVRLQVRFVLQARTPDRPRWARVTAPGFGVWNTSLPGVGRYVYAKTVAQLLAPGSYRAVVRFRWLGLDGRVLQRKTRFSRACRQPDLRPDLVATEFRVLPRPAEQRTQHYVITVRNQGRADAAGFDVAVLIEGRSTRLGQSLSLAAGSWTRLEHDGPPCVAGELVALVVDPVGAVDERDESGNRVTAVCPSTSNA